MVQHAAATDHLEGTKRGKVMSDNSHLFAAPDTWLLNVGYVSENSEQNLLLYGYLSAPGVLQVELLIDAENYLIKYAVVLGGKSLILFRLQKRLESITAIYGKLLLACFLKFFGSYNPAARISRCVKDYAGERWRTATEVIDVKQYNKVSEQDRAKGWFFKDRINED